MSGDDMGNVNTMVTIPHNLKKEAKEKGINMSKILAEALAKELETGIHLEHLKEKLRVYERKVEITRKEIEECEILLKERQAKEAKEKNYKELEVEKAVALLRDKYFRDDHIPNEAIQFHAERLGIDYQKLEELVMESIK